MRALDEAGRQQKCSLCPGLLLERFDTDVFNFDCHNLIAKVEVLDTLLRDIPVLPRSGVDVLPWPHFKSGSVPARAYCVPGHMYGATSRAMLYRAGDAAGSIGAFYVNPRFAAGQRNKNTTSGTS